VERTEERNGALKKAKGPKIEEKQGETSM